MLSPYAVVGALNLSIAAHQATDLHHRQHQLRDHACQCQLLLIGVQVARPSPASAIDARVEAMTCGSDMMQQTIAIVDDRAKFQGQMLVVGAHLLSVSSALKS